ncbi:MAG: efflux RND transporter permease subunit, partial [Candidatus Cloacimonadaceae bacterium]|nr:efflux RND transporter permease subunit [Candidatus Cloacimonadaceae bacterium]
VGMVVDNAIVVLENTHRYREEGYCHKDAIIMGVDQVIMPVFSSTLTTIAAFMPMLLMVGIMGKFLSVFPIVVTVALLGSWFQSMVVLPNNVHQFGRHVSSGNDRTAKVIKPLVDRYKKLLVMVLKHRSIALWSLVGMLILSFGILGSGLIKFEFFPSALSQTMQLQLQTPLGTTLDETERIVTQVEEFILNMPESEDILFVVGNVGAYGSEGRRIINSNYAQLNIDLVDLKDMKYTHEQIRNSIRDYLDKLAGLYSSRFTQGRSGPPVGNDIELRVKGDNLERLAFISETLISSLKKIPGVVDLDDSFDSGKMEVRIKPDQEKLSMYGLTVAQIASTIRTASSGSEVSKFRGSGIDEHPLIVKLDDKYTQDLEILKNLKIRTRGGELIAIRDLAEFEFANSLSSIEHRDKKRVVTVTGSVSTYDEDGKSRKRTTKEVLDILFGNRVRGIEGMIPNFEQRYPGYTIEYGGIQEEQNKSYASLGRAFLLALLVIFTILASQFRSYVQPLIVMMTIPFAFIGVIIGLLVTGLAFSLNSLISVVALAGVVVNNAIILIDFINQEREKGVDRWHAIINSGAVRLRPILLTTTTTVAGMLPLVFSTDPSSQSWRPLAASFTFGLLFATILTLFIIPVIYSMVDSFFGRFGMTRFSEHTKLTDALDCKT